LVLVQVMAEVWAMVLAQGLDEDSEQELAEEWVLMLVWESAKEWGLQWVPLSDGA